MNSVKGEIMTELPRRPGDIRAVGLNQQGLILRSDTGDYPVVDHEGVHLQPSDFNGLKLPCLPLEDELGELHYLAVTSAGTLILDGNIVGQAQGGSDEPVQD